MRTSWPRGREEGDPGRGSNCVKKPSVFGATENWVPVLAPSLTSQVIGRWTQFSLV